MRAILLLATATALMLNGSASAQVAQDRWTFAVLTIWQLGGDPGSSEPRRTPHRASIKREPWGLFTSEDDCNRARAKKIAELDERHLRQPHLTANAPTISTTVSQGSTSVTSEQKGGPIETMVVTECEQPDD
jgi:hypothetical protein